MLRRFPLVAAGLLVLGASTLIGGCGGAKAKKAEKPAKPSPGVDLSIFRAGDCKPVGAHAGVSYQLCWRPIDNQHGTLVITQGGERTGIALGSPGKTATSTPAGLAGYWYWGALSPDGTMFLTHWVRECEEATAFFVPAAGGKPVPVTGESDWAQSPDSLALGWTTDGRAIVFIYGTAACGKGFSHPGLYLVTTGLERQLLWAGKEPPERLVRSLEPRSVASLRALLGPSGS
jgi:hypothetical protein